MRRNTTQVPKGIPHSKLEDAFFEVEKTSIFATTAPVEEGLELFSHYVKKPISGFKAIQRKRDGYVYAVVKDDYQLITNRQAYELGKICFATVFGSSSLDNMKFLNLRMPQTESYCHMDFYADDEVVYLNGDSSNSNEKWQVFLRISNSYNRTIALKFDIGFCRWICRNGMIFDNNSIQFKYKHNKKAENIQADFELKYKSMSTVKAIFEKKIGLLQQKELKREEFMPEIYKALSLKPFESKKDGLSREKIEEARQRVEARDKYLEELIQHYCEINGSNAYALLNVLTDYASRPKAAASPLDANEDSLERRVGNWMMKYV